MLASIVQRLALGLVASILFTCLHIPYPSLNSNESFIWDKHSPEGRRHRFLLLTAHPDDECMFFGPTLVNLLASESNEVHSMCLSSGNADGLGDTRLKELGKSLNVFGVHRDKRIVLADTYVICV